MSAHLLRYFVQATVENNYKGKIFSNIWKKIVSSPGKYLCSGMQWRVESPSDGIQGDEPHVARLTRQNIYSTTLLKPRAASSASPSEGIHGMTEEHSTEFRRPYTSQREIKLPVTSSRSQQGSRHWLWTAIAVMTGAVVLLTADMETFQRHQLVLGHFKEIKGEVFDA
ncbi:hypothetical protein OS493_029948 [Desmophyllum pertusum]|uniref:Uncharacterized protein n=1 Tax=Desmophyllum pertusum TaxID=174260 RepID=A0A9X0D7G8_9CNID|nr:hypothetical protein OS493_029948 [Desmophyllum pertusum]